MQPRVLLSDFQFKSMKQKCRNADSMLAQFTVLRATMQFINPMYPTVSSSSSFFSVLFLLLLFFLFRFPRSFLIFRFSLFCSFFFPSLFFSPSPRTLLFILFLFPLFLFFLSMKFFLSFLLHVLASFFLFVLPHLII
jgi:hypothetical protein